MKINRDNYEVWFLDYCEGRLSPQQVEELKAFLDLHYDLKEELDSFENISLPPAKKIVFDLKESLKKSVINAVGSINKKNYEEFFIADVEGELTKEKKTELNIFIEKNLQLNKEFELFQKTKITPDASITFPAKEVLKKNIIISVGSLNENNYAEYFIAAMENDLTLAQQADLKEFLNKNPQLHKEYNFFGQTRLAVDTAIIFNRKQQLKQPVFTKKIFDLKSIYYSVSIAASVIIIMAIYFLLNKVEIISVKTASRNNIELHRNIQEKATHPVITDNSADNKYFAFSNNENKNNEKQKNIIQNVKQNYSGNEEFQYVAALKPAMIQQQNENEISFNEKTIYEDYYAMKLKKESKVDEEKSSEKKYISLKDFALLKLKRSITPEDKKDKITPANSRITLWDVADAGISKINKVTGANARLNHNNDNGNFSFALDNKFKVSRNKNSHK